MIKTAILFGLLGAAPVPALADTCCYAVPVKVTLADGSTLSGNLRMYGNEIRGKLPDGREHVIGFGAGEPSTDKKLYEPVDYGFSLIRVKGRTIEVFFGKKKHLIKNVSYLFEPEGLVVYQHVGGPILKKLSLKEIRSVRRTGKIYMDNTREGSPPDDELGD